MIFRWKLQLFGTVWIHVCCVLSFFVFLFFFFLPRLFPQQAVLFMYGIWIVTATFDRSSVNSTSVHYLRIHKFHFLLIFSLKIGPTVLFTHLKIILLQCFQFSIFSNNKFNPNTPSMSLICLVFMVLVLHCFSFVTIVLCSLVFVFFFFISRICIALHSCISS